jgi:Na+/H+ antiporter NhaD/arsenite permease-like protein
LFVVVHGLTMTRAVELYVGKLLGHPKTLAGAQLRLIGSVTFISVLLNNTLFVAVMIPIVIRWAKTIGISASQLLIPLSYGAIIGRTCTLISTSTNLVVLGLLQDNYSIEMTLFDITPYGVPVQLMWLSG